MLGLSSGLIKGASALRSIVKKGLQAWYKADKTQAPLGEEEIANGKFATGPELVSNGDFSDGLTGWVNTGDKAIITNENGHIRVQNNTEELAHWNQKMIRQLITYETGKQYKLSFKIRANYTGSDFFVRAKYNSSTNGRINNLEGGNGDYITIDTNWTEHVFYFTAGASYIDISFGDADWHETSNNALANQYFEIDNVSVKRTNPNDSWENNGNVTFQDGLAKLARNTGVAGGLRQNDVFVVGRNYEITYEIVTTQTNGFYISQHGGGVNLEKSVGVHTLKFTPGTGITYLNFVRNSADDGPSIDFKSISVKEVTNSVRDFSPNNNNGVLYSGKALNFDNNGSADDEIDIGDIALTGEFTVALWYNVDTSHDSDHGIFGDGTTDDNLSVQTNTKFRLRIGGVQVGFYNFNQDVEPDVWARIVLTRDSNNNIKLYRNNILSTNSHQNTSTFTVSNLGKQGAYEFGGSISDFQVYDKAWTASDVTYDYNNPDKDVFDDKDRQRAITESLIPAISDTPNFTASSTGTLTAWGPQFLNDHLYTKSGDTITFGRLVSSPSARLYPPQLNDTINGVFVTNNIVDGNEYVLKYNVLSKSGGLDDLRLYTGSTNTYQEIPVEIGENEYQFTFRGVSRSSLPLQIHSTSSTNPTITFSDFSIHRVTTKKAEITETDCIALYRLNEGAGDRVYNAAPVLREDLTKDYDFDDTTWSTLDDTTIDNANTFTTYQASGIFKSNVAIDSTYKVTIAGTVSTSAGNGLEFRNAGNNDVYHTIPSDGEFSSTFVFKATHSQTYLKNNSAGTTTITTFKLQEISLSESYVQASWAASNWMTAQPYIPQYAMSSYSKKAIFAGAGSGDYVELGTQKVIPAADPFSFSFWYYNIDESTDQPILGRDGSTDDYLVLDDGHKGLAYKSNGVNRYLNFNSDLTTGKLNHIVFTSTGGEVTNGLKCYVNGVLQSDTGNSLSTDFYYRDIMHSQGTFGEGFIDELAHFSKELSVTEVQEIFNGGMALDCRDHSAANTGSEVFANGFDTLNLDPPADTSNGRITISSYSGLLRKTSVLKANTAYKVTMNIESFTSGKIYCGGTQITISETGLQTFYVTSSSITDFGFNDPVDITASSLSVIEVNLKGYWRNNGTETWTDLSLYENDGTVNGSPTTIQLQEVPYFKKDTFGLPMNKVRRKGLNLDGDSYIKVDDHNDFNMSSGFSTSFWVNCRDVNTRQWLVTKGTAVNSHASDLGFGTAIFKPDGLYPRVYASINTDVNKYQTHTTETIVENDWLYVTVTYTPDEDNGFKLYINEDLIDTDTPNTGATIDETHDLYIGENYELDTGYRSSSIVDDVKWYNRPLDLSEIKKNYNATKSQHKNNTVSNWSDDFSDGFI